MGMSAVPSKTKTTVAGRVVPFFSKFLVDKTTRRDVYAALASAVNPWEFAAITTVAWAAEPLASHLYKTWWRSDEQREFQNSRLYHASRDLSSVAKVGVFLYATDCLAVMLNAMGFPYLQQVGLSRIAANICLTCWVSLRVKRFKKWILDRAFRDDDEPDGTTKARVYDHVLNGLLYMLTATIIIGRLHLPTGKTLFAIGGGGGTLVASLASKDLATQIVSGLSIQASVPFLIGDTVELGDGTYGTVTKVGLLCTEVRGNNEVTTRIPNSQISNQRVSNWSRANQCQVAQTLLFSYKDIDKMPDVIRSIKEEIRSSCPDLITDGSRPFRVNWTRYTTDRLEVDVDCRFNLATNDESFYDIQQDVMLAIARAVRKEGATFALPSYVSRNMEIPSDVQLPMEEQNTRDKPNLGVGP